MARRVMKYMVYVNGVLEPAENAHKAHEKVRRLIESEFMVAFVVRQEYSHQGNLLEEFLEG
jgi:hypothetical protein